MYRGIMVNIECLKKFSSTLRIDSIKATSASNSGHPTSCSSMAEIIAVLFGKVMRYTTRDPRDPNSDRFVLSKGHSAPILYAAWAEVGLFPVDNLRFLRKLHSDLEGHPTPRLSFVDVATGSLGQGINIAAGMAYVGKYFDKAPYRVFCLIGDGESAEGSVWEALSFASHYSLNNLVIIIDINRLGQSEPTVFQHDVEAYKQRTDAFGCNSIVVDGHNVEKLLSAFGEAEKCIDKPSVILAKTFKGRDFVGIENEENWHGKPLGDKAAGVLEELNRAVANGHCTGLNIEPTAPSSTSLTKPNLIGNIRLSSAPNYPAGKKVATREAYGNALVKIATNCAGVIALDGDVKNSTFSIKLKQKFPNRFIECYIAEQNMVGVAIGCATRERTVPFCSTFAAFFTRAADHLRMAAISQTDCNFVGSHCGVSIGADGPSQMALEDLALFRAIPTCTVFYPFDAVATERAVELAANTRGMCYIRTGRPAVDIFYKSDEVFAVGKAKVVRRSDNDCVTVVAAGVTLEEGIKAADALTQLNINIRLIDPFTIKPLDVECIVKNARETGGLIVTVEDHYPEGGLGEAVSAAVATLRDVGVHRLAVLEVPRSGEPAELLSKYKIDKNAIVALVRQLVGKTH